MNADDLKHLADLLRMHKYDIDDDMTDEPDGKPYLDVRLQLLSNGWQWSLRTGDASYDTDHSGFWGSGCLTRDTDCDELAMDLYDQALEHRAQDTILED